MSYAIQIIDPELEKKRRRNRKILAAGIIFFIGMLSYPMVKQFSPKWQTYIAARKMGVFLNALKTQAILKKKVLEARFVPPGLVEVFETTSCGPDRRGTKLYDFTIRSPIEFVIGEQVQKLKLDGAGKIPTVSRFCYDPLYGSSLLADGYTEAVVYMAHHDDLMAENAEHVVSLRLEESSGDLYVE